MILYDFYKSRSYNISYYCRNNGIRNLSSKEKIKVPEFNVEVRNKTMVRLAEVLGGVLENRHTG